MAVMILLLHVWDDNYTGGVDDDNNNFVIVTFVQPSFASYKRGTYHLHHAIINPTCYTSWLQGIKE